LLARKAAGHVMLLMMMMYLYIFVDFLHEMFWQQLIQNFEIPKTLMF